MMMMMMMIIIIIIINFFAPTRGFVDPQPLWGQVSKIQA
jgi:hypothetical protein